MGTMARTAVIAGTASAVSGAVAGKQVQKQAAAAQAQSAEAAEQQELASMQQQLSELQAQQAAAAMAPPPAAPATSMMEQLERLGQMKAQGLLTDEEFAAAKARLLAG